MEPGFVAENVAVASLPAPSIRYKSDASVVALYREVLEQFRGIPGVDAVAMSSRLPFGNQRWSSDFTADGWPAERFGMGVRHDEIALELFRTMGVPLLRGRDFDSSDDIDSTPVVIINEALATTYFAGEDPVGRRVTFSRTPEEGSTWRTIVDVSR